MESIPLIVILAILGIGLCLMIAAITLNLLYIGREIGAPSTPQGRWPLPTRLLLVGALLCAASFLLAFVPGVVPWWDYSEPWLVWEQGAVVGFITATLYWRFGAIHALWRNAGSPRSHRGSEAAPPAGR